MLLDCKKFAYVYGLVAGFLSFQGGRCLSPCPMQSMIEEFDRDLDGEISEAEFMYIMKQTSIY